MKQTINNKLIAPVEEDNKKYLERNNIPYRAVPRYNGGTDII